MAGCSYSLQQEPYQESASRLARARDGAGWMIPYVGMADKTIAHLAVVNGVRQEGLARERKVCRAMSLTEEKPLPLPERKMFW